jgi:hypothetical protein
MDTSKKQDRLAKGLVFDCNCGWKYRVAENDESDLTDLKDVVSFHDPGDSCCTCASWKCLACFDDLAHDNCIPNCPDCCVLDEDGYSPMDRQRALSSWWSNSDTGEFEAIDPNTYPTAFAAGHNGRDSKLFPTSSV